MPNTNYDILSDDTRAVAHAMALLWTWRPRTMIVELLRHLDAKTGNRRFSQEDVKTAIARLQQVGWASEHRARPGYFVLTEPFRTHMYAQVLERHAAQPLRDALYRQVNFNPEQVRYYWPLYEIPPTVAIVRLAMHTGTSAAILGKWKEAIASRLDWNIIFQEAILEGSFDTGLFERITPEWRWDTMYMAAQSVSLYWHPNLLPMARWGLEKILAKPEDKPGYLKLQFAEWCLLSELNATMDALLDSDSSSSANALRAARLIIQGEWAAGQSAYEAALKNRQAEVGAKKRVFPESLTWFYPLALLAQGTPKHIELARKFCISESGTRTPPANAGWGLWAHACAVRQGDAPLDKHAFDLAHHDGPNFDIDALWALLLRAWLADMAPLPASGKERMRHDDVVTRLRRQLHKVGLTWLEGQTQAADKVLRGEPVDVPFFAGGGQEAWRNVLDTLRALAGEGGASTDRSGEQGEIRLIWEIVPGKNGQLEDILVHEQKRGARGWSKLKPASLGKLAGNTTLPPHDVKVARALRQSRHHAKNYFVELSSAIMALVGHPHVVLVGAPDTFIDVVEGTPQLETLRETGKDGERIVLRISPQPHQDPSDSDEWRYYMEEAQRRDAEALRYIHVQQESAQRLKVIRLTPAQRRAAQLVSGKFSVPAAAQNELQDALRALAGHFSVHSDDAAAAREIAAVSTLRAELAPAGDGLLLRLVVAPLGPLGPRLMPGRGRRRVMAAIAGESVGTERDLNKEATHLDTFLERLDFLDPPQPADSVCEWTVDDPEQALAMVESLPQLSAIEAVDWPRGKAVRVATVDLKQMQVTVKSERDWFRVDGHVALDEGRVFALQELLAAAAQKSRFIALGEGQYLALSKALREKLQALAAVTESDKSGLKAPALVAAWLDETLDQLMVTFDSQFQARIERLRQAQDAQPTLPATLQAELRPYQEDGFAWALRLADAGFGACLADDMGLGKTLQALAVMLTRASGGPALVIAPTSVCGNWLAEAARFAPTLNAQIYGEGERKTLIDAAGPGDLVIASYTLMQQAGEDFAARTWHTLVADEAQAVKNATAKRSQALFDLPADFRLALSGTPVENRLTELWSIMRFCNAGLLGTQNRFTERFANPIERGRDREAQRSACCVASSRRLFCAAPRRKCSMTSRRAPS